MEHPFVDLQGGTLLAPIPNPKALENMTLSEIKTKCKVVNGRDIQLR
jgi:hypothetical protein